MAVLGVDACKKGWIAVRLDSDGRAVGRFATSLAGLLIASDDVTTVAIDMPIGLPSDGARAADRLVRHFVGPRSSSVFTTPVRDALQAETYEDALRIARARTSRGITKQAYGLRTRIFEVERWCLESNLPTICEVHPEASFTQLLGHPPSASKKTWSGMEERRAALAGVGIDLSEIGSAGELALVDDVLDAAIAAWSARRIEEGEATAIPDPAEVDPVTGLTMAIWM